MDDLRKNASGCFDLTAYYAMKNIDRKSDDRTALRDYVHKKLKMIKEDFFVNPTEQEVLSLFACKNEYSVDKKAVGIIISHWEKE